MESYQELLEESYEEEHADAVRYAHRSFENWLDLIFWDLIEVHEAAQSLQESIDVEKKLKYAIHILKEDVQILNDHTRGSPKIFLIRDSNLVLIRIAGIIQEILSMLDEEDKRLLNDAVDELKAALKLYNDNKKNRVYSFIEAKKRWYLLSAHEKERVLHDFDVRVEKNDEETGERLKW